jgi:hypothetical protein
MLKKLFRGVVVLLAVVGAYATARFLFWPSPVIVFEDENWVVLLMEGERGRCVVMDRNGAPIPDFPLDTWSDSAGVSGKTDSAGRGSYLSYDPQSAIAELPTGAVRWLDMGFAVLVRKRP